MSTIMSGMEAVLNTTVQWLVRFSTFLSSGTVGATFVELIINLATAMLTIEVLFLCALQFISIRDPGLRGQDIWMPALTKRMRKNADKRKMEAIKLNMKAQGINRDALIVNSKTGEVLGKAVDILKKKRRR